jgi:hypothetical protein
LLDFDHFGAEVAEKHGAIGTGKHARQIEHADAGEGATIRFAHGSKRSDADSFESFNHFAPFKTFKPITKTIRSLELDAFGFEKIFQRFYAQPQARHAAGNGGDFDGFENLFRACA